MPSEMVSEGVLLTWFFQFEAAMTVNTIAIVLINFILKLVSHFYNLFYLIW